MIEIFTHKKLFFKFWLRCYVPFIGSKAFRQNSLQKPGETKHSGTLLICPLEDHQTLVVNIGVTGRDTNIEIKEIANLTFSTPKNVVKSRALPIQPQKCFKYSKIFLQECPNQTK